MSTDWGPDFEAVLRGFLPFLGEDEPLTPQTDLRDTGLDSLGTVELLGKLEAQYEVRFVDEALSRETFATPGTLWAAVARLSDPGA
ncbi:phosphopantetheine-binding protein [Streptomyces sp. NBC_00328]|uniref:phosphopantetheine-binding protein n=1 Tax=Streptomyces sp. NBC_00328 TaxID=2903646 RepID=UPI002E2B5CFC|nr:phosphopantetheine-binding protein [Streptomyces sp. NBC_00328]